MSTSRAVNNNKKVVCVTGADGLIGSWLVKVLLSKGYTVHATVLEQPGSPQNAHLMKLEGDSANLKLFKADIMDFASVTSAINGCSGVFHVASAVYSPDTYHNREKFDVTVNGTGSVLDACNNAQVERIVYVSSATAFAFATKSPNDIVYDESCWSDLDYLEEIKNWYGLAKTMTEQLVVKNHRECAQLNVVTICPTTVWGPVLGTNINESTRDFIFHLEGRDTLENRHRWVVDVRDLVDALILVYENHEVEDRYICSSYRFTTRELIEILKRIFPTLKYPTNYIECDNYRIINSGKLQSLGWQSRPLEETLIDSSKSYMEAGILEEYSNKYFVSDC